MTNTIKLLDKKREYIYLLFNSKQVLSQERDEQFPCCVCVEGDVEGEQMWSIDSLVIKFKDIVRIKRSNKDMVIQDKNHVYH